MAKLVYKELREKQGKQAILGWQTLCNWFGFDPDPTITTEITAEATVVDPHANPSVDERLGEPVEAPVVLDSTPERPTTKPEPEKEKK